MQTLDHNLDLLKRMKDGEIADFEDRDYPSIKREDDGFYMLNDMDEYFYSYRHKSLLNLGSYFCFVPLEIRKTCYHELAHGQQVQGA